MSANPSSSVTGSDDAPNPGMSDLDNPVAEEGAAPSTDTTGPAAFTTALSSSSRTGTAPIESGTPVAPIVDSQMEMSRTLDRAGEALDTVKTWKTTVSTIKCVMDTVSPILKVCTKYLSPLSFADFIPPQLNPYASLAWSMFSKIPEVRVLTLSEVNGSFIQLFFHFATRP